MGSIQKCKLENTKNNIYEFIKNVIFYIIDFLIYNFIFIIESNYKQNLFFNKFC